MRRWALVLTLVAAVLVWMRCGGTSSSSHSVNGGGGGTFSNVYVVVLENEAYSTIIGNPAMPFLNGLATQHGLATNYFANTHPSIGNYFMMTTGQIITNDDTFTGQVSAENIAGDLTAAGKTWKVYAQSLPAAGYLGGDVYPYVKHHNPFAYFQNVISDPQQAANIVPLGQFAPGGANFSFIVPDDQHNTHDCPPGMATCTLADKLSTADNFLQSTLTPLLNDPGFQQSGLLVVMFDESDLSDTAHGGGHIAVVVVNGNGKAGFQSTTFYQHQSALATWLSVLGVSARPGAASGAPVMSEFWQ